MRRKAMGWMSAILGLAVTSTVEAGNIQVWAMAGAGNGNLFRIDEPADTVSFIGAIKDPLTGDVGSGWSTDAITPDGTLYFLRRNQATDHIYSLNSNNIQVTAGVITNVQAVASTGLGGNLDGLTGGPDGNLYFTAYDNNVAGNVRNGLFRYNLVGANTGTVDFVGTFANNAGPSGVNSFYTDLSFDPMTGDLVGTGINSTGAFIPWRLHNNQVVGQTNQSFTYVNAFAGWNGLSDGLAYNRDTGDLYASSDTGGVYRVDRNTGAILNVLAGTNSAFGGQIGTDLAILPIDQVATPEPATLVSAGIAGLIGLGAFLRRRRRSA